MRGALMDSKRHVRFGLVYRGENYPKSGTATLVLRRLRDCGKSKTWCHVYELQLVAPERIALTVKYCRELSPRQEGTKMSSFISINKGKAAEEGAAYTDQFLGLRIVFTSWTGKRHTGMITRFEGLYPVATLDCGGWVRLDSVVELAKAPVKAGQ